MPSSLKVGVVGVGYLGRYHAEKYAALPETSLVGVADLAWERARDVARALGTEAFADYRLLFPEIEAVSVAVTTKDHYLVVREALEAGLHVLVEKPLAATVAEADDLLRLAQKYDRLLMVGHLERFNSAMTALRGLATTPRFIESHRLGFFKERGTDVDVVLDLMIHDLDHVLSLVPSRVMEIRAAGISVLTSTVDLANVRLEFAGGCIANLTASRMSLKSMRRFRVFQPDAYLAVDFEAQELTVAMRREGATGLIPGVALDIKRFPKEDVLLKEIQAFVHSVRNGVPVPVSGEDGRAALKLATDIIAVMRQAKV
jgi:predicted dehydrogenase